MDTVIGPKPTFEPTPGAPVAQLQETVKLARAALPEVPASAYVPSGKAGVLAKIVMLGSAAAFAFLLLAFCADQASRFSGGEYGSDGNFGQRRVEGIVIFLVDVAVLNGIILVPSWIFPRLGRLLASRSPALAAAAAGAASLAGVIGCFWPFWDLPYTLTSLTFVGLFSVKWPIIIVATAIAPLASASRAAASVADQRFCEDGRVYLRRLRYLRVSLDKAGAILSELTAGKFANALRLAAREDAGAPSHAEVVLWGHAQAQMAYLEMTVIFNVKSQGTKIFGLPNGDAKRIRERWAVFSRRLSTDEARELAQID